VDILPVEWSDKGLVQLIEDPVRDLIPPGLQIFDMSGKDFSFFL
jgi:hypothetical protein